MPSRYSTVEPGQARSPANFLLSQSFSDTFSISWENLIKKSKLFLFGWSFSQFPQPCSFSLSDIRILLREIKTHARKNLAELCSKTFRSSCRGRNHNPFLQVKMANELGQTLITAYFFSDPPPPRGGGGGKGSLGREAQPRPSRSCLRQKSSISLPCSRQETIQFNSIQFNYLFTLYKIFT